MTVWLTRLLTIYAFAAPWCYGLFEVGGNRVALSDFLMPVSAILLVVMAARKRWSVPMVALLAFAFSAAISILPLLQADIFPSLAMKVLRLFGTIMPGILFGLLRPSVKRLAKLLNAFYFGCLASIVYGLVAFYLQLESGTAVQTYYYTNSLYLHRAGGVFQDSGAFGHLLATWFGVSILIPRLTPLKKVTRIMLYSVTTCLTAIGLYASLSRSAMLNVLVVAVGVFAVPTDFRKDARRLVRVGLVALLLIPVASPLISLVRSSNDDMIKSSLGRFVDTIDSTIQGEEAFDLAGGNRLTSWSRAIKLWTENPVLGVGYKALGPAYGMVSDNSIIVILSETGAVGLLFFLVFIAAVFRHSLQAYAECRPGAREVLIILLGQSLHGLTADTLTFLGSATILILCSIGWYQLVRYRWPLEPRVHHSWRWPQATQPV